METEYTTYADYDFKKNLVIQYQIAYNLLAESMIMLDDENKEKDARTAIVKLLLPLYPKIKELRKAEQIDYSAWFIANPENMHLIDITTMFFILQDTMENLGLTKFESYQVPKHEAYKENGE